MHVCVHVCLMCDQVVEGNPCFEYVAYIVFPWFGSFEVARNEKNGGNVTYTTVEQLKADYVSGALHPGGNASAADTFLFLSADATIQPEVDRNAHLCLVK